MFFLLIVLLVCTSQLAVSSIENDTISEMDCSSYMSLVDFVIKDDDNLVQVQTIFFPTQSSPPAFVTVYYNFGFDEKVWFYSEAFFYLFHPLHIFQFTSLFFSDLNIASSEVGYTEVSFKMQSLIRSRDGTLYRITTAILYTVLCTTHTEDQNMLLN